MIERLVTTDIGFIEVEITKIQHPIHNMFYLVFSDGYENIFFTDPETGIWVEQDLGFTDLADELGIILSEKCPKPNLRDITWLEYDDDVSSTQFGFYKYCISEYPAFEIYNINRRYMYTLVKIENDLWQVFRLAGPGEWEAGASLVNKLPYILEDPIF